MKKNTEAEFWSKVNKRGPVHPILGTECWVWLSLANYDGYGLFYMENKQVRAHRLSWFMAYGVWPTPCALHKCDNRLCIRPEHMFEGTRTANYQDREAKGRTAARESNGRFI